MTTIADLISETKRIIFSSDREQMNRLTSTITAGATTLACDFVLGGIVAGAVISIDQELLYVWSTATPNVTVQRGYLGSTAAAHTSQAIIYVNPRYSEFAIFQALNQELDDLSSPAAGLFQVKAVELTNVIGVIGLDVNFTNLIDILEVHYRTSTSSRWWTRTDGWRLINNANTTDFPSGRALIFQTQPGINGAIIRITYKSAFVRATAVTDDVATTCGLPVTAADIPPMGAAAKLTLLRAIKRGFDDSQGEPRRASEVPPNAEEAAAQSIFALRNRRVVAEAARLKALYMSRMVN